MKKLNQSILLLTLLASIIGYNAYGAEDGEIKTTDEVLGEKGSTVRADDVPSTAAGRNYIPGMSFGDDSIKGASYSNNLKIDANFSAFANLSCGSFDFTQVDREIKRQIDRVTVKAQQIPNMLNNTLGGALSTLPNYVIAKYNPTLYQLLQKGVDEYAEMLNIATKSCRDIENEIASNPDGNPYQNILKVATADQWKRNIDAYNTSSESMESLQAKAEEELKDAGVMLADGKYYGGKDQEPVNFTKSITVAGVNMLLGRTDKREWDQEFAVTESTTENNPLFKDFKSPDELYQFISDIYGSTDTRLPDGSTHVSRTPGRGYEKEYLKIRNELYPLIKQRMNKEITRNDFEKQTGIIIPPVEWDDIRILPRYQKTVEIEALTKRQAIKKLKERLIFAKSVIKAGVYSPDLQTSSTREAAISEYKNLYYRIIDDIAEIQQRAYQY